MSLERVAEMASRLFEGKKWFENHRKIGELSERVDLQVLECVSQLDEFDSFNDEQKRVALGLGLALKDNIMGEFIEAGGPDFARHRNIERQISMALELAKKVGIEFVQDITRTVPALVEEALGLRKMA